jgi:YjbE family integral membrane protein
LFHYAHSGFIALLQVIFIDITMAGDNAVVISLAAARVVAHDRRKVIFWGLVWAVILRVILASFIRGVLAIIGFTLAGGILLLWVCWRLYRDIHTDFQDERESAAPHGTSHALPTVDESRTVRRAIIQIALADLSMSLDNVLAVAGASVNHPFILAIGLVLSIGLIGIASSYVARLLHRHPWISYAGLFIVLYVAITMIVRGSNEVMQVMS